MSTLIEDISGQKALITKQMPQAGDILGHCRLIELIAAGGMANVYKVWHEQLEVLRAIKILKPGFDDESKNRLETEAKISANLKHTNIVEIYEMGYWNNIPFIEMEFIDGPSLKEVLEKRGRLPVTFAIALAHSLCSALHFAHNQDLTLYGKVYDGLIHRDIKPANILISSKGLVKLADFGIARPSDVSLHTVGGKVMGTFAYLSPEQLNGERLDRRTDIYALGAVLYEMLTGSKTYPQKVLAELFHRKTKGHYIPVSSLCKEAPKQLCALVEKSLCIDMGKRHACADDFDKELLSILRKLTSNSTDYIICQFTKNPVSSPKRSMSLKSTYLPAPAILSIIFLLMIISGVFLLNRYSDRFFQIQQESIIVQQQKKIPAKVSDTASILDNQVKYKQKRVADSQKALQGIRFEKAVKAYNAGDYTSAIYQLKSISIKNTDISKKNTRSVLLLQSYIKNGYADSALSFSESESCDDAFFFFLRGELLFKNKQLENAEEEFKKAQTMQTQFEKNIYRNASLYLARIRDEYYMLKPNIDNKIMCSRAWSSFIDAYCLDNDNSPECNTARNRLSSLSH